MPDPQPAPSSLVVLLTTRIAQITAVIAALLVIYTEGATAYPHNAGEGLIVILDAMPLKGRHIVLLELDEADDRRLLAEARRHERERKAKAAAKEDKELTACPWLALPKIGNLTMAPFCL